MVGLVSILTACLVALIATIGLLYLVNRNPVYGYGWYSQKMSDYMNGYDENGLYRYERNNYTPRRGVVWLTTDGREVYITDVNHDPKKPFIKWDDAVFVGPVSSYVRQWY